MSESINEKMANIEIRYDPADKEFDHKSAYGDGGEMKNRIESVITLAVEHGAPIMIAAAVDNLPDTNTTMLLSVNEREGLGLPSNIQLAVQIMGLDGNELGLIHQIVSLMEAAKINVTQVQSNIESATKNVVDMLKGEGLSEDGLEIETEGAEGQPTSVN